jgi:hypothetical protein
MKPNREFCSERTMVGLAWLLALAILMPVLYLAGAIAVRVAYIRGYLPDHSKRLEFLVVAFSPLQRVYDRCPTFRSAYERCGGGPIPNRLWEANRSAKIQ